MRWSGREREWQMKDETMHYTRGWQTLCEKGAFIYAITHWHSNDVDVDYLTIYTKHIIKRVVRTSIRYRESNPKSSRQQMRVEKYIQVTS